jgi:hypothetical protein
VPNNAVSVARFFIEAKGHGIHLRQVFELAGMHQPSRFGLQDLKK